MEAEDMRELRKLGKEKLFRQLKARMQPLKDYEPVAIDANNIIGPIINEWNIYDVLKQMAWRSLIKEYDPKQFEDVALLRFNEVIKEFFRKLKPLLSQAKCIVVFDGRKPEAKKHFKYAKKNKNEFDYYPGHTPWLLKYTQLYCHYGTIMNFCMIRNLKAAGIQVQVAPWQADTQIISLYPNKIKSVYSGDHGFIFHNIPLMTAVWRGKATCDIIDPKLFLTDQVKTKIPIIRQYAEKANANTRSIQESRYIFGVMSGAGYVMRHPKLKMIDIMRAVLACSSIPDFVVCAKKLDTRYGQYQLWIEEDYILEAELALKAFKYGTYWDQGFKHLNHNEARKYIRTERDREVVGSDQGYLFTQKHFEGEKVILPGKENQDNREIEFVWGYTDKQKIESLFVYEDWLLEDIQWEQYDLALQKSSQSWVQELEEILLGNQFDEIFDVEYDSDDEYWPETPEEKLYSWYRVAYPYSKYYEEAPDSD